MERRLDDTSHCELELHPAWVFWILSGTAIWWMVASVFG